MQGSMMVNFLPTLFIGIFLGCILCLSLYGVMLALHNRAQRRAVDEIFEHIASDERIIATAYYPPEYRVRAVK
jgi:hypothetical protein